MHHRVETMVHNKGIEHLVQGQSVKDPFLSMFFYGFTLVNVIMYRGFHSYGIFMGV